MWYFKVRPVRVPVSLGKFIAWCAQIPELGDGPLDIDLAEEVHVEFGDDPDETLARLKKEVYQ